MVSLEWFRLQPTDEQLVSFLEKKRLDPAFNDSMIKEINIYKCHPRELLGLSSMSDEQGSYIFCMLDPKHTKGKLKNRKAKGGSWKITCRGSKIMAEDSNRQIGVRRTLSFYEGSINKKENRTDYKMYEYHEYPRKDNSSFQGEAVVCRIEKKPSKKRKSSLAFDEGQPSDSFAYDSGNNVSEDILQVEPQLPQNLHLPSSYNNDVANSNLMEVRKNISHIDSFKCQLVHLTPNGSVSSTDMASNSGNHDPEITAFLEWQLRREPQPPAFQVESQLPQEPQSLANREISFDRTSQLLPNYGFPQNRETQPVPFRVLYGNSQLSPNYNEQDWWNSQSAFECEFYGQETGHYHTPISVPEDSRTKSQSTIQSEFYGQEIEHSYPLREREDDKRNSQSAVQTEFYGQQEVGHSHPTDFNLSKPITGDSLYYGSDEAISALNNGSAETIAASLYGFSSMAYEYDFNSMYQSQVYPLDENIPPVSMGSVV